MTLASPDPAAAEPCLPPLSTVPMQACWSPVLYLMAAAAGGMHAVTAAVQLTPADRMRPAAPARFHRSLVEWLGLSWLIPLTARMILRQLHRRRVSALFSSHGEIHLVERRRLSTNPLPAAAANATNAAVA